MARKGTPADPRSGVSKGDLEERKWRTIAIIANVIADVVDKFGWPGAIIIFAATVFVTNATPQQKQYAVDVYLLGKTTPGAAVVAAVFFVLVLFAQLARYKQKESKLSEMLRRSEEKSDRLTEQLAEAKRQITAGQKVDAKGLSTTSGTQ